MTLAGRARSWLWTAPAAILVAGLCWAVALASQSHLPGADFTFNNNSEVSTLDPAAVSSIPEGRILRALYEGLVIRNPENLAILPGAAESWEMTADGLQWSFRLREGLSWLFPGPLLLVFSRRRHPSSAIGPIFAYKGW